MNFMERTSKCESDTVNVDSLTPISKRFQKNVICQNKPNGFYISDCNSSNALSRIDKTDAKTELRLLRLSSSNVSMSRERNEGRDRIIPPSPGKRENKDEINYDWGRRTELHNIFHINDGHKIWNIFRRGLFSNIKLWKNSYGNINCKATGKISIKEISEISIIEINTEDNLRKLLSLSHIQWSALCEAIDEKNVTLSFNAFEEVDLSKLCFLNKLWFFICKRRHFLPNVSVLGKVSGAVKLMKELTIAPKIIVMEIRDFKGNELC